MESGKKGPRVPQPRTLPGGGGRIKNRKGKGRTPQREEKVKGGRATEPFNFQVRKRNKRETKKTNREIRKGGVRAT